MFDPHLPVQTISGEPVEIIRIVPDDYPIIAYLPLTNEVLRYQMDGKRESIAPRDLVNIS